MPDVPRHAVRIGAEPGALAHERPVGYRARGAAAHRTVWPGQHVERFVDGGVAEVVEGAVLIVHRAVLRADVVRPGIEEVALDTEYLARRVGEEGRDAATTLDVTPADVHVDAVVVLAVERLVRITLRRQIRRRADGGALLRRQQRIRARDEGVLEEVTARRDLRR